MERGQRHARGGTSSRVAGPTARRRFTTRRRLLATLASILALFLAGFVAQVRAIRGMEATIAAMSEHEERMSLALSLEDAIRDQFTARVSLRDGGDRAAYDDARARVHTFADRLTECVDDDEAVAWVKEIRDASIRLDEMTRGGMVLVSRGGTAPDDGSGPLVALIDRNIELIVSRLKETTSALRTGLLRVEATAGRWLAALLLATPLSIGLAALYLSRHVAAPLAKLSAGAAAIAADPSARIDIASDDEFGALAQDFNEMTAALRRQRDQLVESEKLAAVGRAMGGMAHELNNPLQVMLGYLSLNRKVPHRRVVEHLAAIDAEVFRCKAIVDGVLDLTRPAEAPCKVAVDVRGACDEAVARVRAARDVGHLRLHVDGAGTAQADPKKLGQALFNLVDNAAEAAGPEGEVRLVIAGAPGGAVEVTVADSGPGLDAMARAHVFEPFFTTKGTGTGLGLALARAIARAHGGDLAVENAPGGGAVFKLRLPAAAGEAG